MLYSAILLTLSIANQTSRIQDELRSAISKNDEVVVRRLLTSFDVDPYARTTPMLAATTSNSRKYVLMMIEAGFSVDEVEPRSGMSPVMYACSYSSEEIALLLIKHSELPGACNINGRTALHGACRRGSKAIVVALLNKGKNRNSRDQAGRTPLIELAKGPSKDSSIATALIKAGANPLFTDNEGRNAIQWAVASKKPIAFVNALRSKKNEPFQPMAPTGEPDRL